MNTRKRTKPTLGALITATTGNAVDGKHPVTGTVVWLGATQGMLKVDDEGEWPADTMFFFYTDGWRYTT